MIGRVVDVAADLSRVEVRLDGRLVAAHDRSRARGRTITDPAHVAAAKVLREQYQSPRPAADPHGDPGDPGDHEELGRDLAEYDRAFGLLDALTEGEVA